MTMTSRFSVLLALLLIGCSEPEPAVDCAYQDMMLEYDNRGPDDPPYEPEPCKEYDQ